MNAELRRAILSRDGECILYKRDKSHVCRDQWGEVHQPWELPRLSIEHVKSELRMGKRAASDKAHMVAMCYGANIAVPSKVQRQWMRAYLQEVNA